MFKTVFLMLGEHCNFQCKYCMQHPIMTEQLSSDINPDLIPYIKSLCGDEILRVIFYGGEPLLYWQNIVEIHSQLKDSNISFGIISNGSLLNDEMTAYIVENKIGLAISQDGANCAEFRGQNVLDNPRTLANIHRINASVSAVVHAQNMDITGILDYWWEKGIPVERTNLDLIMDTGLQNRALTDFDWTEWQKVCDQLESKIYDSLTTGNPTPEMYLGNQLISKIKRLVNLEDEAACERSCSSKCGVGITTLNVDLQGNAYVCHNSSERIGTIYDSYEILVESFKPHREIVVTEKCKECPVRILCNGGCILVPQEARDRYYCQMYQAFYGAFINAILRAGSEINV